MRAAGLGLLLGLLALAGCGPQDVRLDRDHVEWDRDAVATRGQVCSLPLFELVDVRPDPRLGAIGAQELLYPELREWLDEHLRRAASTDDGAPRLQIELNRAYLETHPSGHSFQLVLRARAVDTPAGDWRVYRGSSIGLTLWESDGAFGSYVRRAGFAAIKALVMAEGACRAGR